MHLQEFNHDFIFELDFGLQFFNLLILRIFLPLDSFCGIGEGGMGVLKELLLPLVNLCLLQTQLIAEIGYANLVH